LNQVIIPNSSAIAGSDIMLPAEGAHIHKINNKYYIFLITWPRDGMRTVLCYQADTITGPWEGRVVLQDSGIAQGGLIDTPDGKWYALLFGDRGAVGRIPYLVPVTWEDNWPIFGIDGKVPEEVDIRKRSHHQIVSSDEFERQKGDSDLGLAWQWNHNPDNENWSLTERQGFLRLRTGSLSKSLVDARNTVTQRTFGPKCSGIVAVEISEMRIGDYAGLAVLQKNYGFVGVKMSQAGKEIIMMDGSLNPPVEVDHINVEHEPVYFKIACDFREQKDLAYFYYSIDGKDWVAIGSTLKMTYTIPHFMGYRFALFNFSTEEIGGYVDFDYFRLENSS
ncbi:MAG: glycoside hydrolase, partial [Bacillota bacterium]|nr:glycoside hydrolase [Bacillota bacterium]